MNARTSLAVSLPLVAITGLLLTERAAAGPPAPLAVAASADAWISQARPDANHGREASLIVSGDERALVRFSRTRVADALAGRSLVSAKLEVRVFAVRGGWGHAPHGAAARTVDVHRLEQAWSEGGVTWNSPDERARPRVRWDMRGRGARPYAGEATASAVIAQAGVVSFDVTADVLAWLDEERADHGWLLKRRDEQRGCGELELRAGESGQGPRLVLTAGEPPPPPPAPVGIVANADTYVSRTIPHRTHGSDAVLRVRARGGLLHWLGPDRALVRFDELANAAAVGSVERAVPELSIAGVHMPHDCAPLAIGAHRMTQGWTEAGASWKSSGDGAWSMQHPPFPFAAAATAVAPVLRGQRGVLSFDVTADVRRIAEEGAPNLGWHQTSSNARQTASHSDCRSNRDRMRCGNRR